MENNQLYMNLLDEVRSAYCDHHEMMEFKQFPDDIVRQSISPHHCPCADVLYNETGLTSKMYPKLQDAIVAAGPAACWRETYKDTDIGSYFMDNFGCYCIIGECGPFSSESIRLYIVYMPPNLYYPWHNHPAEEIYWVLSGSAIFKRENSPDQVLCAGDTSYHRSNQPHAMHTTEMPVLCLVAWRNEFQTPPILTKDNTSLT
jgi:quercetin dioxygenase-like cupin family protein